MYTPSIADRRLEEALLCPTYSNRQLMQEVKATKAWIRNDFLSTCSPVLLCIEFGRSQFWYRRRDCHSWEGFRVFSQPLPANISTVPLPSTSFPVRYSPSFTIRCYAFWPIRSFQLAIPVSLTYTQCFMPQQSFYDVVGLLNLQINISMCIAVKHN